MDKNRNPGRHGKIIRETCIYLNNCADCYSEDMHRTRTECNPSDRMGDRVHGITENSFRMEVYSEDTARELSAIALQYGYSAGTAMEDGEEWTIFEKRKQEARHVRDIK